MAFASLIHRPSEIPWRFDSGISSTRRCFASSVRLCPSPRRAPSSSPSVGGRWFYCARLPRMQCFKETTEDLKLSEEVKIAGLQSCAEDSDIRNVASDTSLGRQNGAISRQSSVRNVALCVLAAVTFGLALGVKDGLGKASEYFAGYMLEQSLSVDNLFVFVLVFKYFKVPAEYQLFTAEDKDTDLADNFIVRTCQRFIPVTAHYDGDRFITMGNGIWKATPLLLTVAVIELSDIAFAIDSIPAVFGVTRDPFIVFSSNLFAILGNCYVCSFYALI
ncbi:hypothetical protein KSP39_PZI021593 [Platanthera zijinensis]|uniref:Uncharacterized protein n=1 Tax=Platanthera zijinensis TaxID=2320716 RepID=A0AAP0FWH5_9ASPA